MHRFRTNNTQTGVRRRRAHYPLSIVGITALTLFACGGEVLEPLEEGEQIGVAHQAIEIGTNDVSDHIRDAVVKVWTGGGFCTGTLIAPDKVVTAAHCNFDDQSLADGQWHRFARGNVTVGFGPRMRVNTRTVRGNYVSIPPIATAGPWPLDDIALIHLDDMVPTETASPRTVYFDRPYDLSAASRIYEAGYGGGRDRRIMTGNDYRDWTTDGSILRNGFKYTPTFRGPGIGDRATNIEGGDSGGPIFAASPTGPLIGVLSWWDPYGIATFGPGGAGRPSIRDWLRGHVMSNPTHGWVWAHASTGVYQSETSYSHTPSGRATVSYHGGGRYSVRFPGVGRVFGAASVHVQAYGSDANYCKLERTESVNDDFVARVRCYNPWGSWARSRFVVSYVRQHMLNGAGGLANLVTAGRGTRIDKQWNVLGYGLQLARTSLGKYRVTLSGQRSHLESSVQVTAVGSDSTRCKVRSWGGSPHIRANVVCHNPSGARADSDFQLLFAARRTPHRGPGGHAWVNNTSASSFTPSRTYQYHSNRDTVTAGTRSDGVQWVRFPGLSRTGAVPHVTAYGDDANYCKINSWGSSVKVRCYDTSGTLTPSRYTASYMTR